MAGEYRGRAEIFPFLRRTAELTGGSYRADLLDVFGGDDVVVGLYRATGRRDGARARHPAGARLPLRAARAAGGAGGPGDPDAFDAFWAEARRPPCRREWARGDHTMAWSASKSCSQRAMSRRSSSSRAERWAATSVDVRPVVRELPLELGDARPRGPRSPPRALELGRPRRLRAGRASRFSFARRPGLDGLRRLRALGAARAVRRPSRRRRSGSSRPRSPASARRPRRAARGRARRAGPCPGRPRAPPRAPRGSRGRGGSSARRGRGSSRPRRRRCASASRRRSPPESTATGFSCASQPEKRKRPSRFCACGRERPVARLGAVEHGAAVGRARPPAARSTPARRRGRAVRRSCAGSPVRAPSRAASSCRSRSARRARRARRARARTPTSVDAACLLADRRARAPPPRARPAAARRLEELEAERARLPRQQRGLLARGPPLLLEPLDLRQLRLRLLGLRLLVAEPLDEALEPRDVVRDAVGRLRRVGRALRLLAPPDVPRPGEERRAAGLELEHRRSSPPRGTSGRARRGSRRRRATASSCSSHSRLATSRWFVGSSSSSRSGSPPSARASDARVSSPPENVVERPVEVARRAKPRPRSDGRLRGRASRSRRRARAAPAPRRSAAASRRRGRRRPSPPRAGAAPPRARRRSARAGEDVLAQRQAALERRPLVVQRDARRPSANASSPPCSSVSPASMRSSVVLPAPFGPGERHAVAALDLERDAVEEQVARRAPCAGWMR